jgi:hypothetical protein
MNPSKIVLSFLPFAAFTVLANWVPVGWAALVGALAAIVVVLIDVRRGIKILPTVQFAVLAAFAVLGFLGGGFAQTLLHFYGRGLAALVLGVYILATAGFAPFTSQFAKTMVPRAQWASERFLRVNRHLSTAWGGTVLVTAVSHLIAGAMEAAHLTAPVFTLGLNWVVPILAILWTLKYSKKVAQQEAGPVVRPAA